MLKAHADIAVDCGIPRENTFVLGNGEVLSLYKGKITKKGTVPAGDVYVDGNRIGDVSNAVMKDRKIIGNDGIVVVIANIDINNNKLLGNPNITTRGFVQVNENQEMLRKLEEIAKHAINLKITKQINYAEIKSQIISELSDYINLTTGRKPIILPVIMNIKKESK